MKKMSKQKKKDEIETKKQYIPARIMVNGGKLNLQAPEIVRRTADGIVVRPKARLDIDWEKTVIGTGGPRVAVGLFRLGAISNDNAVVIKTAHRYGAGRKDGSNYIIARGRVPFFAPRTPGIFIFRLLDAQQPANRKVYGISCTMTVAVGWSDLLEQLDQAVESLTAKNDSSIKFIKPTILTNLIAIFSELPRATKVRAEYFASCRDRTAQCIFAIDTFLQRQQPGPSCLAAMRKAGEFQLDDDTEQEKSDNQFSQARKSRELHVAIYTLYYSLITSGGGRSLLEESKNEANLIVQRLQCWDPVLEEFWPDAAAKQRQIERGSLYPRIFAQSAEQYLVNIDALDIAAKRALPRIVPGDEFFQSRDITRRRVEDYLKKRVHPDLHLHVFGSSVNLFGAAGADLDMCASLPAAELAAFSSHARLLAEQDLEKNDLQAPWRLLIKRIGQVLSEASFVVPGATKIRDTARVPIVLFEDQDTGLDCDVSTHNPLALRNSQLLRTYASIDWRVRAVAYVIKLWAKARNINSPTDATLSSYGYILCVIFFFQSACDPPLLPSLQRLPPDWPNASSGQCPAQFTDHPFEMNKSVDLYFHQLEDAQANDFRTLRAAAKANKKTVAQLVAAFFDFYAWRFDFRKHAISIKHARPFSKTLKAEYALWPPNGRLAIEDPFETWYDVAHVLKQHTHNLIHVEFMRADHILKTFKPHADTGPVDILEALCQERQQVHLDAPQQRPVEDDDDDDDILHDLANELNNTSVI
mmetsp:Transcript_1312/g.1696  ORF Transcript_1312/g.1696 Transcript_1312/m.1696 type:complete len:755 (-) Transcript_1312:686-2950(-)